MAVTPNTLTVLVPTLIASLQRVLRQSGAILNATTVDATADQAAVGQTVNLPGTAIQATYEVAPAAVPPANVGTIPTTKTLTLSEYRGTRFALTGEDWRGMAARGADFRAAQIDESIAALVDEISAFVFTKFDLGSGYAVGTAGSNPFASNPNILMDAWEIQSRVKVPSSGRIGVVGTLDWAQAGKLAQFQKLNEAPEGFSFARSEIGMLANYKMTWDQAIGSHTPIGTGTSYVVNGAHAIGATSLVLKTGSGTIVAGDVLTLGSYKYVVGTGIAAPGTVILNSGLLAAASDSDAVAVNAIHRSSLLVHPDACCLSVRPPAEAPDGDAADQIAIIRDPVTGVSLRLAHYKGYHSGQWELSVVYGATIRRPSLAMKLLG